MDESTYRQSQLVNILGQEQIQQILEKFTSLLSCPLCVISSEGEVIARVNSDDTGRVNALRFQINHDQRLVEGISNVSECSFQFISSAPVFFQSEVAGYVVGLVNQPLDDRQDVLARLQVVAEVIGDKAYSEFELDNLTEELVERYDEVNLIYDISDALGAVLDSLTVCAVIIEKAVGVIGVEKASVMLYDEARGVLRIEGIEASYGLDLSEEELRQITVAPGEGVSGTVFSQGEYILVENTASPLLPDLAIVGKNHKERQSISPFLSKYRKKAFLSVPMICTPKDAERKVMGVINMTDKKRSDMFTSGDIQLLKAIASQAATSLYNIQLIEEVKDAERVKKEMEIAQQIQEGLLPRRPPSLPGIELAGRCLPATQVGGDYYDFFLSADNKLGLVIADVSGHNIGAALMMAVARSTLRSEVFTQKSPAKILQNTNFVLYQDLTHAELFITIFYAEYNMTTRVLRYSNGGHNHPIVLREGSCTFLDANGMLIGMLESVDFEEKTIHLQPNDFVIFYTDGVVEAVNETGEMFKLPRFCRVVEAHCQSSAHELLDTIYEELAGYSGSTLRSDDITVVVLKIH